MDKSKIKSFIKKNNRILAFSLLLIISGVFFYYFVVAEDSDSNKLTIKNITISNIKDGEVAFDADDNAGNDSSNNNGRVRNFDSINYIVDFDLAKKNEEDTVSTSDQRNVIVDVLFPSSIDGVVMAGMNPAGYTLQTVFGNYKYVEFLEQVEVGNKRIDFTLTNINGANDTTINPIVIIKEQTDEDKKAISELTDEQRNGSYDAVSSNFIKSTCANTIGENTTCETKITGVENYFVRLYTGSISKNNLDTNIPVGILIGLDKRKTSNNEDKGIKGLLLPTTISFDIEVSSSSENNSVTYNDNSIRPYRSSNLDYKVYIDDNNSIELPEIDMGDTVGNGDITAETVSEGNKKIHVTLSNIKNKLDALNENSFYLSTNSFELTSSRNGYAQTAEDINLTISATSGTTTLSSVTATDSYSRYVGTYESRIKLYDTVEDITASNNKKDGEAQLNYNEEFYIDATMQYGMTSGDGLENLTNYIKIDNDAIKLLLYNNLEYQVRTGVVNSSVEAPAASKVMFGYGKWTSEYFKISASAPSGCPTEISGLTKENLMNLYGGPCIEENTDKVKWSENFEGIDDQGNPILTEEEKEYGPIIVRTLYTPGENGEYVYPTSYSDMTLKAKIKNNYQLVNTTHQITTSGVANFKNDEGTVSSYYLSNKNNHSDVALMSNPNNYVKTDYDFTNKRVNSINTTTCPDTLSCAVSGNTILVSGVRVSKPQVKTYYNDIDTTNFYYYPIEWRINANAYKNDTESNTSFEEAYIYAYIPKYLRYISYGSKNDFREPTNTETVTINGTEYNKLTYKFNNTEIENGVIPEFSIYTSIYLDTPNNSRPEVYVESDFIVKKRIENADSTYTEHVYSAINGIEDRRTTINNVTIHNNSDVTTQGVANPTYFEKNKSYTYKMQAFNNSASDGAAGYEYTNPELYYVLPYNHDSAYEDSSSSFKATGFKVKLSALPSGYKAYYTSGVSSNIISDQVSSTSGSAATWIEWTNPTTEISNATAIKVVKNSSFRQNEYFGGNDGITVTVTPVGAAVGDAFYNTFYLVADRPSDLYCKDEESDPSESICDPTTRSDKIYYNASRTMTSIYNRQIAGIVFEDYDYSGLFDNNESKLENIPVSLYKLNDDTKEYDSNNPASFVDDATWVADTTTNVNGEYIFRGLSEGKYYVKFTYDDEKYTPTDKDIQSSSTDTNVTNSKALPLPGKNVAISSVVTFSNGGTLRVTDMNLGLKIKKQFTVDIDKYITHIVLNSNKGVENYDYDNATSVTLNLKNLRNTSATVTYSFVVENTKYFPGYVGVIADRMPDGMTFNSNLKENQDWVLYGNTLYYTGLSGRLLIPGNKYYFNLVLDLDIKEGGTYTNIVAVRDLILMGEELSEYDFNSLDPFSESEQQESTGEGE